MIRNTKRASQILQLALWSNLFMAASAAGWVIVSALLLDLPLDWALIALAFTLAVAFYTRDRLDEKAFIVDATTMPQRTAWVKRHTAQLSRLIWVAFGVALLLLLLRPAALPPILAGLGFALTYTVRWLPLQGQRVGWKHLPGMKMPFVALLWTVLTVLTPATVYQKLWQQESWLLSAVICLLIMIQILINDLRDTKGDKKSGTASLPVLLGDTAARRVGYFLGMMAIFLILPLSAIALPLTTLYSLLLLWCYRREQDARLRLWIEIQGVVAALFTLLTTVQ